MTGFKNWYAGCSKDNQNENNDKERPMNRKNLYRLTTTLMALIVAGIFLFCDFGLGITPMTKFFVVFFGLLIGLQCIPAALLFVGMIKGIFSRSEAPVNQVIR